MPKRSSNAVVYPSAETLRKYGMLLSDWKGLLEEQGGVCAICRRLPSSGRLNVDHYHVKGWKRMNPDRRRLYVRGLVCFFCNRYYISKGITVEKAKNIIAYLLRWEKRLPPKK